MASIGRNIWFYLLLNTIINPYYHSCVFMTAIYLTISQYLVLMTFDPIYTAVWIRKTNQMSLLYSLFIFYQLLNMFRATMCPSSGADDCVILQPRVGKCRGCRKAVKTGWQVVRPQDALPTQPPCSHGTYQHKAITSRSRQLLMMGTWLPETC